MDVGLLKPEAIVTSWRSAGAGFAAGVEADAADEAGDTLPAASTAATVYE
jgi:hypothetical protein